MKIGRLHAEQDIRIVVIDIALLPSSCGKPRSALSD